MSAAAWRRVRDVGFYPRVLPNVVEEEVVVQVGLKNNEKKKINP